MFFILLNSKQWRSHLTQWCSREQKRIFFISFHFWRIFPHPRLIPTTSGEGSPNYRLILPFRGWSVVTNETSYFLFPIVFWNRLLTTEDFRKILFFSPQSKFGRRICLKTVLRSICIISSHLEMPNTANVESEGVFFWPPAIS